MRWGGAATAPAETLGEEVDNPRLLLADVDVRHFFFAFFFFFFFAFARAMICALLASEWTQAAFVWQILQPTASRLTSTASPSSWARAGPP